MTGEMIPDTARSEELFFDPRFVQRWTDRVYDIRFKYGQEAANKFAREFLTPEIIRLVNKEIEKRKSHGKPPTT